MQTEPTSSTPEVGESRTDECRRIAQLEQFLPHCTLDPRLRRHHIGARATTSPTISISRFCNRLTAVWAEFLLERLSPQLELGAYHRQELHIRHDPHLSQYTYQITARLRQ